MTTTMKTCPNCQATVHVDDYRCMCGASFCRRCMMGVMQRHTPEHSRYRRASKCSECRYIDRDVVSLGTLDKEEGWQGLACDAIISIGWEMN